MVPSRRSPGREHGVGHMLDVGCSRITSWSYLFDRAFAFYSRSHLHLLATIYARRLLQLHLTYLLPTHKLIYSWSRGCEIAESPWLTDYFQNQMQGPMIPLQMIWPSSSGSSMKTLVVTTCLSQMISSGAQLGRLGTLSHLGVVLHLGSVVEPWV